MSSSYSAGVEPATKRLINLLCRHGITNKTANEWSREPDERECISTIPLQKGRLSIYKKSFHLDDCVPVEFLCVTGILYPAVKGHLNLGLKLDDGTTMRIDFEEARFLYGFTDLLTLVKPGLAREFG